jgi:hypothetical protein
MKKVYSFSLILVAGLAVAVAVTAFNNPSGNPPTGSGALTVDSGLNVGIGKTPSYKLDVNGIINGTALYVGGAPYVGSQWTTSGSNIYYNTGNVAIGLTDPGTYKLKIGGTAQMTGFQLGTSATAGQVLTADASGVGTWQAVSALPSGSSGQTLRHDGTTWVANSIIINDGTNVGIGITPAVAVKLDVNGNINLVNTGSLGWGGATQNDFIYGTAASHYIGIITNGTERIRIDSSGNVGIGTTGPGTNLHVVSPNNDDSMRIQSASDNTTLKLINTGTGGRTYHITSSGGTSSYGQGKFVIADSAVGYRMVIDSSGNVGIGTASPGSNKLAIAGGNLDLGGNNITGVNKLTVNSIDPVFQINGQQYVTYVPDTIGQKVEIVGQAQLVNGEWKIDLSQQKENSDLWLFYQIVKPETIISLISSQSNASLYGYIDGSNLVVKLKDGDPQAKFSYQLTASRIDEKTDYLLPEKLSNTFIDIDSLKK